jgi:hypothetical protein
MDKGMTFINVVEVSGRKEQNVHHGFFHGFFHCSLRGGVVGKLLVIELFLELKFVSTFFFVHAGSLCVNPHQKNAKDVMHYTLTMIFVRKPTSTQPANTNIQKQ